MRRAQWKSAHEAEAAVVTAEATEVVAEAVATAAVAQAIEADAAGNSALSLDKTPTRQTCRGFVIEGNAAVHL